MSAQHRVRVASGKYTIVKALDGTVEIYRGEMRWGVLTQGLGAITSMMAELDAARVVVQAVRAARVNSERLRDDARLDLIEAALTHHDGLVDDREAPSEWAK